MKDTLRPAILAHAQACYPKEACGLVVALADDTQEYVPCQNLAGATDHFVLCPHDYAAAEERGRILAVVHSHPDAPPTPSQADRVACEASGLPWHIISIPQGQWAHLMPEGYTAPLLGRMWCHGVLDCYSLIRDWYRLERGIVLPDFTRSDEWWLKNQNLYVDNFRAAGFTRIVDEDALQPGDVLLMQIMAPVPNHGAVYLGDGIILHHLHGRLSCREVWGGYYKKHTTHILRHDYAA